MTSLETRWILWFHDTRNNNWSKDTYAILNVATTVEDVRRIHTIFETHPDVQRYRMNAMLFWMRERHVTTTRRRFIYPMWEDSNNVSGGTLCVNGDAEHLLRLFWHMVARVSGETLLKDPNLNVQHINGVSIVPKSNGAAIVKIWYAVLPKMSKDWVECVTREWHDDVSTRVADFKLYVVPHTKMIDKDTVKTKQHMRAEYHKERALQKSEQSRRRRFNKSRPRRRNHTNISRGTWRRVSSRRRSHTPKRDDVGDIS